VPRYTIKDAPLIATGNIDQSTADYFNNTFTLGDPTWATSDQNIIDTNGWDLQIEYLTGEQSLMDLIAARNETQQPVLFYFWTPHAVHKIFDLVRVQLPDNGT
jgi:glycine betaine/proline transport system substrate-binding protein